MNRVLIAVVATIPLFAFSFASAPAIAAKSPAMEACSAQWKDMKAAGKTEGKKWPEFWSQCSKDYAAKNGGDAGTAAAAPEKPATPAKADKAEKADKPAKKTASVDESDGESSAQQKKDCDAKWTANKASSGAHGWHDYFHFMAGCM